MSAYTIFFLGLALFFHEASANSFGDEIFDKNFSFVEIEPGEFLMGSPPEESGRFPDQILHPVKITRPFQMGRTEVTQGMWKKVMGKLPSDVDQFDDDAPVTYISWIEVQNFIQRLRKLRKGDGFEYRLPTEAEWEYAARGAHKTSLGEKRRAYYFGDDVSRLNEHSWNWSNSKIGPKPVATRTPNQVGLYDIVGNVAEWVEDSYSRDRSNLQVNAKFGHPVNQKGGARKVLRGGCFTASKRALRSAFRGHLPETSRIGALGFRLVRIQEGEVYEKFAITPVR